MPSTFGQSRLFGRAAMEAASRAEGLGGEHPRLSNGVRGVGAASLLGDLGHEVPTALLPSLLTATLGAPASALGLIEGVSDGPGGAAHLAARGLADDPQRRRPAAVGGYSATGCSRG